MGGLGHGGGEGRGHRFAARGLLQGRPLLVQVGLAHVDGVAPGDEVIAGDQPVADEAHGVEIGAAVHLPPEPLLRGHKAGAAEDLTVDGEGGGGLVGDELGEAEVDDLHHRPAVSELHQQVAGLEIPVHHPVIMAGGQGVEGLTEQLDDLVEGELAHLQQLLEAHPIHPLHHHGGGAVFEDVVIDEGDEVGVDQGGDGLGLSLEAAPHIGLLEGGALGLEHLDGDVAAEALIHRLIDHPHAARAEDTYDLVSIEEDLPDPVVCRVVHQTAMMSSERSTPLSMRRFASAPDVERWSIRRSRRGRYTRPAGSSSA